MVNIRTRLMRKIIIRRKITVIIKVAIKILINESYILYNYIVVTIIMATALGKRIIK